MALEHSIDNETFAGLNESIQEHYVQEGDNYFLQANGMTPKAKVDEFRNNNIELKKVGEQYQATITDLTEKLKTASSGIDKDQVDLMVKEQLGKRVAAMNDEHKVQLGAANERGDKLEKTLGGLIISDAVAREAMAIGVKETALPDLLTRAMNVFRVEGDKAIPYNGDDVLYGKDGLTPLSMKDWLAGQAIEAPHLFKESTGSGAKTTKDGGGAAQKRISRADFDAKNPAEQMAYVKAGGIVI